MSTDIASKGARSRGQAVLVRIATDRHGGTQAISVKHHEGKLSSLPLIVTSSSPDIDYLLDDKTE